MKRMINLLVLVTLLALTFGAQGVNSVQASEAAITIMAAPGLLSLRPASQRG